MKKLTDKQKMFCEEYMIDFNGTQAAIRSGYSKNSANEQASRLLANVNIQEYLNELKTKRSNKLEVTAEKVLKELYNWAYGDFTDIMELSFSDIKELPKEVRRLITGFERVISTDGDRSTEKIKLQFVDKKAAMDMINKHISFYAPEEKKIELKDVPLFPDVNYEDDKQD